MADYNEIADRIAADIASGRRRPGERLPPQRAFAHASGIAVSTAGRVYAELRRRGLIVGEVGRGSFVGAVEARPRPALVEPGEGLVDLEMNFPILDEEPAWLAPALVKLVGRAEALRAALRPIGATASTGARLLAVQALARAGWQPPADRVLFSGNGRQGLAAALSALARAGDSIGLEALTFPVVHALIGRLGLKAVPLALDDEGVLPKAIEKAHLVRPLRALYLQPTLHNPLGMTMGLARRRAVIEVATRLGIPIVEDAVYGFLDRQAPPPLTALAPEQVIFVDSLSKRVAPGLTLGFVVPPGSLVEPVARALRAGCWQAAGFALEMSLRWIEDGTVGRLEVAKRRDAARRQAMAHKALSAWSIRAHPAAYHLWLDLPRPWRAEAFAAAAGRAGIVVTPAAAFAVQAAHAPDAVRLALGAASLKQLSAALAILARLLREGPTAPSLE